MPNEEETHGAYLEVYHGSADALDRKTLGGLVVQGNIRPVALAQGQPGTRVSANGQQCAAQAHQVGRDSQRSSRKHDVRSHRLAGHVDGVAAVRSSAPQHGRGWCYFAGVVSVDTLIWLALAAFLVGVLVGFISVYGEATWAYVRMYG